MGLPEEIEAQRARIAELEAALWRDGLDEGALGAYQAAYRRLEGLLSEQGRGDRHHFVVVIPVADNPHQLSNCLESLRLQCEVYGYGGREQGRYRKVSVMLADDSAEPQNIAANRDLALALDRQGLPVHYFGQAEQLALMDRLGDIDLSGIVGAHRRDAFGHKGQAMMRNIAYLRLAELQARSKDERLLFYTVDADQTFGIKVATKGGARRVDALNYFYHLDSLFSGSGVQVLTGKVVGDPPVSPAVMAGNFLDDVIAFVGELAGCDPDAAYRQPAPDTHASGEAAYHDMAELFGFMPKEEVYRYRCTLAGRPSNAECLADFSRQLRCFLHGEHPTRVTWYRYCAVDDSVQPARTVYTGNYVFTPEALRWFIPFAPLRLRMSGPTMGRMLRAELGAAFVSANVPMLHERTLNSSGESEFRPGVVSTPGMVDLSDELERQFFGDVLLFSMERLTESGYPSPTLGQEQIGAMLDALYDELRHRYRDRQRRILARLDHLAYLLDAPGHWWHRRADMRVPLTGFRHFLRSTAHNFGPESTLSHCIGSAEVWQRWRQRQLEALCRLPDDRRVWQRALTAINDRVPR